MHTDPNVPYCDLDKVHQIILWTEKYVKETSLEHKGNNQQDCSLSSEYLYSLLPPSYPDCYTLIKTQVHMDMGILY